jgi:hypothetical protein
MVSGQSATEMTGEDEGNVMGSTYLRCKAARTAGMSHLSTNVGVDDGLGATCFSKLDRVGNLDFGGDHNITRCFRGSRITSAGGVVNQNLCMTFDPLTMTCTVCSNQHHIVPKDGSGMVVLIGDQNFVSTLSGKNSCVPIIRLEDGSLEEMFDLIIEIFDRTPLPPGSHFLVGSVSYLSQVGTGKYCQEWQKMFQAISNRWRQATTGPLFPILRESSPGSTTTLLTELKHWMDGAYGTSISYPKAAWDRMIEILSKGLGDNTSMGHVVSYTSLMPESLIDHNLIPVRFHCSSSLAATTPYSGEATTELLGTLIEQLVENFNLNAHPSDILAGEPAMLVSTTPPNTEYTILVIGASHCRRIATELRKANFQVVDLSKPGWIPTNDNIQLLKDEIAALGDLTPVICVCDLVSNVVFRYEQWDGQLLLPTKRGTTYHMEGKVTTCSKELLVGILGRLSELLEAVPGHKVCIPPLPRYLYKACCDREEHCVGITENRYSEQLLEKTFTIRKQMRDFLTSKHAKVTVPECINEMLPLHTTTASLATGLKEITAEDGVHLTAEGYFKLTEVIIKKIDEQIAAALLVSDGGCGTSRYYWRGFVSPVGSARPKNSNAFHRNRSAGGKWKGDGGKSADMGKRLYRPGGRDRY